MIFAWSGGGVRLTDKSSERDSTEARSQSASTFRVPPGHKAPRKSAMFLQLMSVIYAGYLAWAAWITVGMIDFIQSTRAGTYVSQAGLFDDAEPIEEMALIVERSQGNRFGLI